MTTPLRKFYPTGELKRVTNYHGLTKHGVQRTYYPSGQLESIRRWKRGEPIGEHRTYHHDGALFMISYWYAANASIRLEFCRGRPYSVEHHVDGMWHGPITFFYYSGPKRSVQYFEHGKPHGTETHYAETGEVLYTRYWLDGFEVSWEEYRKRELILTLAGIED